MGDYASGRSFRRTRSVPTLLPGSPFVFICSVHFCTSSLVIFYVLRMNIESHRKQRVKGVIRILRWWRRKGHEKRRAQGRGGTSQKAASTSVAQPGTNTDPPPPPNSPLSIGGKSRVFHWIKTRRRLKELQCNVSHSHSLGKAQGGGGGGGGGRRMEDEELF